MYFLNKIIGFILNPLGIGLLLIAGAWLSSRLSQPSNPSKPSRFPKLSKLLLSLAFAWFWLWSTGIVERWIGLSLERGFPPVLAETMPTADGIVVLGGGMGENANASPYAEMFSSADRAWHGARLYKAGKAPKVFVTSEADARLMVDLGVPREAISCPSGARNTEEEARFIVGAMNGAKANGERPNASKPKILLVTSAWHMRRAGLMYERYARGVEIVPAATDHETMVTMERPLEFKDFMPDPFALGRNAFFFKELIGYYGYKWLRR